MSTSFPPFYPDRKKRVESALDRRLPGEDTTPGPLHEAMRYSTLNGGKRMRGVLVILAGELAEDSPRRILDEVAAAVELIHAYSLVHDDLPAMDDDDYRRGQPSCHRQFNEATAILCGDALLTLSLEVLSDQARHGLDPATVNNLVHEATRAGGSDQLIGGQYIDLHPGEEGSDGRDIQSMYRKKTGSLLGLSLYLGARAANLPETHRTALRQCGQTIGVAFQIQDDLLEESGDFEKIGKDVDSDASGGKNTYPRRVGAPRARTDSESLIETARSTLRNLPYETGRLEAMTDLVIQRRH